MDYRALLELQKRGLASPDEVKLLDQAKAKGLVKPDTMSAVDVAQGAARNFLPSLGNFAYNVTAPIHSPVQTAQGLHHLAAGVGSKIVGAADSVSEAMGGPDLQSQDQADYAEGPMKAVGNFFAERYGTVEGFKKALAEDPVGVIADASAVITGGGTLATRLPGVAGRAGQAVQRVGQAIDPIVATGRAAASAVRTAAPYVGRTAEAYSGVGEGVLSDAYQAGRQGGPGLQTFQDNVTNPGANARPVVDQVNDAVGQLRRNRSQEYDAAMVATRGDQTPLDINAVRTELARLRNQENYRGFAGTGDPRALDALDDIERIIDTFDNLPSGEGRVAEGMDFLKRRVNDVRKATRQGTPENRVSNAMYHATRNQVAQQVPDYAAAMQGYENASDLIDEASRALSVNDRATVDTTLRKLQSVMRNNANTGYGHRAEILNQLEAISPGIRAALAGQALSSWAPRGINRAGIAGGGMTGLAMGANPLIVAALAAASSPRLAGQAAVGAGRAATAIENGMQAAGINAPNVARVTTPANQVGRATEMATPSKQEELALASLRKASKARKNGTGTPEDVERAMSLLAQIVAAQTGQDKESVFNRLLPMFGGGQ